MRNLYTKVHRVLADINLDRLNSDVFAPPGTDTGGLPNAQWPMGLSSNHLGLSDAGWARQANIDQLPRATEMAGVDARNPHTTTRCVPADVCIDEAHAQRVPRVTLASR